MNQKQVNEVVARQTRFMHSFGRWCYNGRFCRSEGGRFGDQFRPRNRLRVLTGLAGPVVLRPNESRTFELVGDVYVQGVMDGNVMELNIEEDIHLVWDFQIKRDAKTVLSSPFDICLASPTTAGF